MPDATNPQSFNRYMYANNNPLQFTDPSGHCAGNWVNDQYEPIPGEDVQCWSIYWLLTFHGHSGLDPQWDYSYGGDYWDSLSADEKRELIRQSGNNLPAAKQSVISGGVSTPNNILYYQLLQLGDKPIMINGHYVYQLAMNSPKGESGTFDKEVIYSLVRESPNTKAQIRLFQLQTLIYAQNYDEMTLNSIGDFVSFVQFVFKGYSQDPFDMADSMSCLSCGHGGQMQMLEDDSYEILRALSMSPEQITGMTYWGQSLADILR